MPEAPRNVGKSERKRPGFPRPDNPFALWKEPSKADD